MGLLTAGVPLPFPDSKKHLTYVRNAGILQFINSYNRVSKLTGDELLWGDEVEYQIYRLSEEDGVKKVELSLRGAELLKELGDLEHKHQQRLEGCNWVPEYGGKDLFFI